eukprot:941056-Pyramimonas_sp.AAC.2
MMRRVSERRAHLGLVLGDLELALALQELQVQAQLLVEGPRVVCGVVVCGEVLYLEVVQVSVRVQSVPLLHLSGQAWKVGFGRAFGAEGATASQR